MSKQEDKDNTMTGYIAIALIGLVIYLWSAYDDGSKAQSGVRQGEYSKEYTEAISIHNKRQLELKNAPKASKDTSFSQSSSSHEAYLDYVKRFKALARFNAAQEDRCSMSKQVLEKAKAQTVDLNAEKLWTGMSKATCSLVK